MIMTRLCVKCKIKRSGFNFEGLSPKYCGDCKENNMVDVLSKKCVECKIKRPTFNFEGLRVKYCVKCKKDNMVNVKNKKCGYCNINYVNPNYKPHCLICFLFLNPKHKRSTQYKTKENIIFEELFKLMPDIKNYGERDKRTGGCSNRRPDFYIELSTYIIIVENDENSHKYYETSCDNKRTMELFQDFNNRPLVMIRFNCDAYDNEKSLFTNNKMGEGIKIRCKKSLKHRLDTLKNTITRYLITGPIKEIEVVHLFYNSCE